MPKPVNFTSVTVRYNDWSWSCDWLKDVKFYGAGILALDLSTSISLHASKCSPKAAIIFFTSAKRENYWYGKTLKKFCWNINFSFGFVAKSSWGGFKIFLMGYGMHLCLFFKTYHRRYLTDISTTAKLFVITAKEAIQLPNITFGTWSCLLNI